MKRKFEWKKYIGQLPAFPSFTQKWEQEFIRIISDNVFAEEVNKILEVGCSNGRWLRWFNKEYGCQVWGVDTEPESFKENSLIKFTAGDAKNLPYKEDFFDVVFSMGLVEHFSKKEKQQILREQNRVLKKGGYLVCQAPLLSFSLNFIYIKYAYDYMKGYRHFRTTGQELKNYFKDLNLEIIFNARIGCLFESNFFKRLNSVKFFKRLLSTEILIIGKK